MIQLSVLKIRGYGPWTLTLGSDREHRLQALQASMYARLQGEFSGLGAIMFPNRHDEFFAVTNGIGAKQHEDIIGSLGFEVGLAASIGSGATPLGADRDAHAARLASNDEVCGRAEGSGPVCIMHLDVEGLTSRGRSSSPYELASEIFELYHVMSRFFLERDSLAFFMGGDNFMVVADRRAEDGAQEFLDAARGRLGMRLNCGIGRAPVPREAARLATESLDMIRNMRKDGSSPGIYEHAAA